MSYTRAMQRAASQHAGSMEWYTPPMLLERVTAFYGGPYYDPCPAFGGTIHENGLTTSWKSRQVFCNPPYGKPIEVWIRKAMTEPAREIILLVPASMETQWFAPLYAHTLCFIRGRIRFMKQGAVMQNAPHPSVLIYRGRRWTRRTCGAVS